MEHIKGNNLNNTKCDVHDVLTQEKPCESLTIFYGPISHLSFISTYRANNVNSGRIRNETFEITFKINECKTGVSILFLYIEFICYF